MAIRRPCFADNLAYSAAKAGRIGLMRSLVDVAGDHDITINAVAPVAASRHPNPLHQPQTFPGGGVAGRSAHLIWWQQLLSAVLLCGLGALVLAVKTSPH